LDFGVNLGFLAAAGILFLVSITYGFHPDEPVTIVFFGIISEYGDERDRWDGNISAATKRSECVPAMTANDVKILSESSARLSFLMSIWSEAVVCRNHV
jgi:hypothetical protein